MQSLKKFYFGKQKIYKGSLLNGLTAYYRLDSSVTDYSGNGNNGFSGGTVSYKGGKINNGIEILTNPSGYAQIPHNNVFNFSNGTSDLPFTISFNVKLNVSKPTGYSCIIDKISSANLAWIVRFYQNKLEVILFGVSGGNIWKKQLNNATVGVFENYAITYDASGTSNGLRIFRNGIEENLVDSSGGAYGRLKTNTRNVTIGVFGDSVSGGAADGIIDDLCIWNRLLTSIEIINNANRTLQLK